jgi:hypothetical protein
MTSEKKEVQKHGFTWEKQLILGVYGAKEEDLKAIKYTAKMDLPATLNALDKCSLSIKTSCNQNAVCMADALRFFDAVNSGDPFHMTVVNYVQDDATTTKKVVAITEVDLSNAGALLFGTLTRANIEELVKAVKAVPQKRSPTDEEKAAMYAVRNALQPMSGAIHLDIKCNSEQSRLQCSFNRFQDFLEKNPTRIKAKSTTNEFRGGAIAAEIVSGRRVFKKKTKTPVSV